MYLAAQVLAHLSGERLLACCLLRLPCRFDLADVLLLDGLVPFAGGARALLLGASDVSVFHPVFLSVCGVWLTMFGLVLRSPSRGPRPASLVLATVSGVIACPVAL